MKTGQKAGLLLLTAIACVAMPPQGFVSAASAQAESDTPARAFAALDSRSDADGAAWYALAVRAREAGDVAIAGRALDRAEQLEYSSARIGLERARVRVLDDDPDAAIGQLQSLADAGFTAVSVITGDPLLSGLAGRPAFDALVAAMSASAYPCEHDEKFREFDFWIGEWEVHDASGQFAGRNVIEAAQRGCMLLENWTSASGGTGMSINYLDHENGEWVQRWIDSSGGQIEIRGGLTDNGMQLTGTIHYTANGTTAPFRGLWTPLPDGRVRQFFEQSDDGGETWDSWFEGFYRRVETPGP
jgi:hypothetical protein